MKWRMTVTIVRHCSTTQSLLHQTAQRSSTAFHLHWRSWTSVLWRISCFYGRRVAWKLLGLPYLPKNRTTTHTACISQFRRKPQSRSSSPLHSQLYLQFSFLHFALMLLSILYFHADTEIKNFKKKKPIHYKFFIFWTCLQEIQLIIFPISKWSLLITIWALVFFKVYIHNRK